MNKYDDSSIDSPFFSIVIALGCCVLLGGLDEVLFHPTYFAENNPLKWYFIGRGIGIPEVIKFIEKDIPEFIKLIVLDILGVSFLIKTVESFCKINFKELYELCAYILQNYKEKEMISLYSNLVHYFTTIIYIILFFILADIFEDYFKDEGWILEALKGFSATLFVVLFCYGSSRISKNGYDKFVGISKKILLFSFILFVGYLPQKIINDWGVHINYYVKVFFNIYIDLMMIMCGYFVLIIPLNDRNEERVDDEEKDVSYKYLWASLVYCILIYLLALFLSHYMPFGKIFLFGGLRFYVLGILLIILANILLFFGCIMVRKKKANSVNDNNDNNDNTSILQE